MRPWYHAGESLRVCVVPTGLLFHASNSAGLSGGVLQYVPCSFDDANAYCETLTRIK